MGNLFSFVTRLGLFQRDMRILMVGLDAAGKTTILYKLKLGDVITTIPTIGFNVETVNYKKLNLTVWDVGGQQKIRALWRYYFQGVGAIIYVVDSNDRERVDGAAAGGDDSAREELANVLRADELRDVPLLVYANKQDLPHRMELAELVDRLGLVNVHDRKWYAQPCNALTGDGLYEGLDWLSTNVK